MAFPTTPVLDNFNRANENPLSAAAGWNTAAAAGDPKTLQVVTNQCQTGASGFYGAQAWATTYGADIECYATLATKSGTGHQGSLFARDASTLLTGYMIEVNLPSDNHVGIYKDDGATLLLDITTTVASGDAFGLSVVGTTITAYRKPSGGSWGAIGNTTDATYSGTGSIGMEIASTGGIVWDDFGGGTVVSGAVVIPRRTLLGVGA